MYDPYQIAPQLQQPVSQQGGIPLAAGTMNPNLNPDDEAVKRQKMLMMAEALRGMQQPTSAPSATGVTQAQPSNPLGSALGGASQVLSLGKSFGG